MKLTDEQIRRLLPHIIAATGLKPFQVEHTVELLQEGGTVPFIARYRKEHTGELDEVQIRTVEEQFAYFCELEERRITVLKSIEEQGKLTPELRERIEASRQKTEIEDLYLPYKPKRRTKAMIARERGLEPLADIIAAQEATSGTPEDAALPFVNPEKEVPDAAAALDGAGHILAERLSDDADARAAVRRLTKEQGVMTSRVAADYKGQVTKFEMYYDFQEPLKAVPSHRMLAMRRGEKEEVLYLSITAPVEQILAGLKSRLILRGEHLHPAAGAGGGGCLQAADRPLHRGGAAPGEQGARRRGGHPGVCPESAGAAAGAPCRGETGAGDRPRLPHRLQAGGGR